MAVAYFAAQLEELGFFATGDFVAQQAVAGKLTLRHQSADALRDYIRDAHNRLTEVERRSIYGRAFGFSLGSIGSPLPNREFQALWMTFLSSVSLYKRADGGDYPATVSTEQVFKAARALAVNLSQHGSDTTHFVAIELMDVITQVRRVLSSADVMQAYGVRDIWQLIERVSQLHLGGGVNVSQRRTIATAGANIIQWLAANAQTLSARSSAPLAALILQPKIGDIHDIAGNVERWLSAAGKVENHAAPRSLTSNTTISAVLTANQKREIHRQVYGLFERADSFRELPVCQQQQIQQDTIKLAERLAQKVELQHDEVDFPPLVASLIEGTFQAIVHANLEQMKAYAELVKAVSTSLDTFAQDNVADNQSRDHLAQRDSQQSQLPRDNGEPNLRPANSTNAAPTPTSGLARIIAMGIHRIVVTNGDIKASFESHLSALEKLLLA